MRFGDLIASRASCLCDKTAVIYNDKEYSYAEIDANANSVAAFLRANGIGVGNHVVYIAYNSEMYFEILTACSRIGAVFTPISWRMCAESIIELVDATDAKVLFVSKSFLEQLETLKHSISGERKIIVIDDVGEDNAAYSGCLAYPNEEISSADRSGEGCLMQIYTSGTTSITMMFTELLQQRKRSMRYLIAGTISSTSIDKRNIGKIVNAIKSLRP